MIDRLKSLLFGDAAPSSQDEALPLAAAALMTEAAMMDGAMAEAERQTIERLLRERFGLSEAAATALRERAGAEQEQSSQLFPFTQVIVDTMPPEQRVEIIEMLWQVAYTDGHLHDYEAALVRRVCGLLYVSDLESGLARKRAMHRLGLPDAPPV
jgi:uncharacterized tellurite resistance protein B-like protein